VKRALILTIDGLVAVTILFTAYSVLLVHSQWGAADRAEALHSELARDYLVLKYRNGVSFTDGNFLTSTGFSVTESRPSSGRWLQGEMWSYPSLAGCVNQSSCVVPVSGANGSLLSSQDSGFGLLKVAWVGA